MQAESKLHDEVVEVYKAVKLLCAQYHVGPVEMRSWMEAINAFDQYGHGFISTEQVTRLVSSQLSSSVLSCPVLSCPVLSCPVLSCPVLSCPVLSCPVLSCSRSARRWTVSDQQQQLVNTRCNKMHRCVPVRACV
jgi:hypothetical protein